MSGNLAPCRTHPMRTTWIATQISVGPRELAAFPHHGVERAIGRARELAGVDAVMIWPRGTKDSMERLVGACHESGVEPWLWFPVLADVPGHPPDPAEQVVLFDGSRGNGRLGAWKGLASGEEDFLFACPNNPDFVDRVFAWFGSLIEGLDIHGVMLDRIRFPSPANGLESLFTCFCSRCAERFQSETGSSLARLAGRAGAFLQRTRQLTGKSFSSEWSRGDTLWTVAGCADLAAFRARSVVRAVERFSRRARERGLSVGLDLFSPSLSGIVAQDYTALAELCDWIKPMLYCHARGPAGFPLEAGSLQDALRQLSPGLTGDDARGIVGAALGMEIPSGGDFPLSTIPHELDRLEALHLPRRVEVMAGLEAVRMPEFGIGIDEGVFAESLSLLSGRCAGCVASWNLLHIPEANLRLLGALSR
jgi:hypothetical protein